MGIINKILLMLDSHTLRITQKRHVNIFINLQEYYVADWNIFVSWDKIQIVATMEVFYRILAVVRRISRFWSPE